MTVTDELLGNNEQYAQGFDKAELAKQPARKLAVVACMDARLNVYGVLGLEEGDAHVIRNPGGLVNEAEIRALAISQRLLGTEEIILIQHTNCGVQGFVDEDFKQQLAEEVGTEPTWGSSAFADLDESLRKSIALIKESPFIPHKQSVRGFVFDVKTGSLREAEA